MTFNGIYINSDNLVQIAFKLKEKIKEIEDCYNTIDNEMKQIDGSTEEWQGDDQKVFYEALYSITQNYDQNLHKLTSIYNFLCKVIDDYDKRDETFGKDLERNNEELKM